MVSCIMLNGYSVEPIVPVVFRIEILKCAVAVRLSSIGAMFANIAIDVHNAPFHPFHGGSSYTETALTESEIWDFDFPLKSD